MTRDASTSPLPDWPATMSIETACDYLDLSESSFRYVTKMAGVRQVDYFGLGVARWRRKDLDGMVDRLPARGECSLPNEPPALTESPNALADAALETVRRSAGK
jgi:hypothetical protein